MMDESNQVERALTDALRAVARADMVRTASAGVEARLVAEMRSMTRSNRLRKRAIAVAMAAALLVAVGLPAWWLTVGRHESTAAAGVEGSRGVPSTGEVATAFLPLTYSGVPISDGQIVRLEVSRAALTSFGLAPIDALDSPASGTVLADVLVGADGLARAVRFVRPASNVSNQERMQ